MLALGGWLSLPGPAAERRHCIEADNPMLTLGGSRCDQRQIDGLAKRRERRRGRDRSAC
jgi:hypothetical protein